MLKTTSFRYTARLRLVLVDALGDGVEEVFLPVAVLLEQPLVSGGRGGIGAT